MKNLITMLFITVIVSTLLFAQKDTVNVASDLGTEGNLNNAVQNAINAGTLSNTVFKLEPYGYYILTGVITVPAGQHLEIVAAVPGNTQTTAPPQIVWTSSGGVTTNISFDCYGDITLKNLWIRYANTAGTQVGCSITMEDNPSADSSGKGEIGVFDGDIFDYSPAPADGSGAIDVICKNFKGTFTNCYFKNDIDTHLRYYGRAVSFPYNTTDWHIDSVSFENCTFANMGYVYMQEGNEYGDNVFFNHCTFLNIMEFTLENGWWYKMATTNCVFVNTYMFGNNPSQTTELGIDPNGGTIRIDSIGAFGFSVPFTTQDRRILFANNSYSLDSWLVSWMKNNPYSQGLHQNRQDDEIPTPEPMLSPGTLVFFDSTNAQGNKAYPYMNKANLYDGSDPGFIYPPTNIDSLKYFLLYKWNTNADTNWAWRPQDGYNQQWPLFENLAYTNDTLKTAAMGGFPLGDLYHWWPSEYTQWQKQANSEHQLIQNALETGNLSGIIAGVNEQAGNTIPAKYTLSQNYPNPFNPTTTIEYSIPKYSYVTLKVYNILGQEVSSLFAGNQKPGKYTATFNGAGFASGVYFYRLESPNVSITKKFVLMK